jgi:hypothetical protein
MVRSLVCVPTENVAISGPGSKVEACNYCPANEEIRHNLTYFMIVKRHIIVLEYQLYIIMKNLSVHLTMIMINKKTVDLIVI